MESFAVDPKATLVRKRVANSLNGLKGRTALKFPVIGKHMTLWTDTESRHERRVGVGNNLKSRATKVKLQKTMARSCCYETCSCNDYLHGLNRCSEVYST